MLKITAILCRAGIMDNYAYLLVDEETGISAVLDPSEAAPVIKECEKQNIIPDYILNTHHHFDHVEGNMELKDLYNAKIVGGTADAYRIEGIDIKVDDGDVFELGKSKAKIIRADGHTIGSILWYFEKDKVLFTGDVLFNLCIGGLFEGTHEQMWNSLNKIKALPDDVMFYPGHEYTMYALQGKTNPILKDYAKRATERILKGLPVAPVSLSEEKKCNPYLNAESVEEFYNLMR